MDNLYLQYLAALPQKNRLVNLAWEVWELQAKVPPGPPAALPEGTQATQLLQEGTILAATGLESPSEACSGLFAELVILFSHAGLLTADSLQFVHFWQSLPPSLWLEPDEAILAELARLNPPQETVLALLFISRQALAPFFRQQALPYQNLFFDSSWGKGVCPFCGQEPVLARLTEEAGRRFLYCGVCSSQWPFPRVTCPYCYKHGYKKLSYLHVNHDPTRRVDLCRSCRRYVKTVDERRLELPLHLPLEEFITLDLDHLAGRRGYH